jgi:hypothetical protein
VLKRFLVQDAYRFWNQILIYGRGKVVETSFKFSF